MIDCTLCAQCYARISCIHCARNASLGAECACQGPQRQPQTTGQSPAPGTNATDVTSPPPKVQQAQDGRVPDPNEIIITATKREENLQNVPISVQVLGTRRLDQLNISNFEQYTKQLPSVTFSTAQPGFTTVYMRGISATGGGAEGNHSGPLPQVGMYLDEQPITTIGGSLDVHIYDIARIESLAGPQGTLYGASSEAGTIRIITNKPELGVTTGRVDSEINDVDHGGVGGKLEGMINLPLGDHIAFRGVAFYEHDAGYIDNVFGAGHCAAIRRWIKMATSMAASTTASTSTTASSSKRTSMISKPTAAEPRSKSTSTTIGRCCPSSCIRKRSPTASGSWMRASPTSIP